jgi:hypothetical protein
VEGKPEPDWDDPVAADIIPSKRAFDAIRKELRVLHESVLMTLTSRSEWFIAQLLHLYLQRYPGAAGISEPFFSVDDLESLQTIDDARAVLLTHKVESIMRDPLEDWLRFLREKPKLSMSYLAEQKPKIEEVFLRRNLVVHNGGRVSRKYLQRVDEALRKGMNLGETAEISTGYLNDSIDLLEQNLVMAGAELWKKLEPTDDHRGSLLLNLAVQRLEEHRWDMARAFSRFGMYDNSLPEFTRLSNQINYWQSFKWAGRYEEIRGEVEASDFSAKSPLFQLAHATIRDDFEAVFRYLPEVLESGTLRKNDLLVWPLFQALRQRPEFASYAPHADESTAEPSNGSDNERNPPLPN